jgi:hypothetical protein
MTEARLGDLLLLLLIAVGQNRELAHALKSLQAALDVGEGLPRGCSRGSFGMPAGGGTQLFQCSGLARPQISALTATPYVGKTSWGTNASSRAPFCELPRISYNSPAIGQGCEESARHRSAAACRSVSVPPARDEVFGRWRSS